MWYNIEKDEVIKMTCDKIIKELYKILEKYGCGREDWNSCYHIHAMINEIDDFLEANTAQHHVCYETFNDNIGIESTYCVVSFVDENGKLDYIDFLNQV